MKCKFCCKEFEGKSSRIYCSALCRNKDPELTLQRTIKKNVNDPSNRIRCIQTNKVFKDIHNISGVLTKHSNNILKKDFTFFDYEIFNYDSPNVENIQCPLCEWKTIDVNNKSGMFTSHIKNKHNINIEEFCIKFPLYSHLWKRQLDKIKFFKDEDNLIECLECNKKFSRINNKHLIKHNMTLVEYKLKYGLITCCSVNSSKNASKLYYEDKIFPTSSLQYSSKSELEIGKFLESNDIKCELQVRRFGTDIDIFLPDYNLAIEYDGLYWHSEHHRGKTRNYHIDKTNILESNQIQLIHIFEDEWKNNTEIVKSRLLNLCNKIKIKVFGRKCNIEMVDSSLSNKFLKENHIQGPSNSLINIGLFYNNELISLMTFSNLRKYGKEKTSLKTEYELNRFCNKINTNVIGAASKLLKYFENMYLPTKLISYADRRWSTNIRPSLYDVIGFEYKGITSVNYWYLLNHKHRMHRYNFAKFKILQKFPSADPSKTEWENMINLGYDRIWDCGSLKYEKNY